MRRLVSAFVGIAAATLSAQLPEFKSSVELVTVPVAVTNNSRDKLITGGLTAADFRVFEDGIPQKVAVFSQDRRPTSLCIVVDASGSMAVSQRHELGIAALQNAVAALDPDDEVAIVRFAEKVTTPMPWTRRPERKKLTWRLDPAAGTVANSSIADGVKAALEVIDAASNPRRAILIVSDGYENNSVTALSRVVTTRAQSEALVYAFSIAGPLERAPGTGAALRNVLPLLVGDSGGVFWIVNSPASAADAALALVNELKFQYTLAYTPSKPMEGSYRKLKVEIALPDLLVRHRGGYLALPSTNTPSPKPK